MDGKPDRQAGTVLKTDCTARYGVRLLCHPNLKRGGIMYYTSYFANIKNLPPDVVPVAICGKSPEGYKGLQYKKLAPTWQIYRDWKYDHHNNETYTHQFQSQILHGHDPIVIEQELLQLTGGKPFCLICYEKPGDFCHRHIVAEWMKESGINIQEYQ